MKYYAVMFFYHWSEIMDHEPDGDKFILRNTLITTDCTIALNAYSETMCPASQFIEANSHKGLLNKMDEMKANFKNEEWIRENIYWTPFP